MNNAHTQKCSAGVDAGKLEFTAQIVLRCSKTPSYLRVLEALLGGLLTREAVDRIGRVSNGPQLIKELRDSGLTRRHLICKRTTVINSDGVKTYRGVYWLTAVGRAAVLEWFAKQVAS